MKNIVFFLIFILFLGSLALAVHFNQISVENKRKLDTERYVRITAEENFEKSQAQIRNLGDDLTRLTSKINNAQKMLDQAKDINAQLQNQIEKAAASQEVLQQQMQNLDEVSTGQDNSEISQQNEAN